MNHEQAFHNLYLELLTQDSVADANDVDRRLMACLPRDTLGTRDANLIVNCFAELTPHLHWEHFDIDREGGGPLTKEEWNEQLARENEEGGDAEQEQEDEAPRTSEARTTQDVAEKLRGFEMQFGFDLALADKFPGTPDETGCSPSYANLAGLLPKGLLPGPEYDYSPGGYNIHILAECLALRIGDNARALPEVQEACGDVIRRVLGEDGSGDRASLYLDEFIHAADRFLATQPDSLLAIAWRGDLACYQGNELEANHRAHELWIESDTADASTIAKLLWFFAIADDNELRREKSFEGPTEPEYCRHLGQRWGTWYDRDEPLAIALLRRAANRVPANAEVLRAGLALAECPGHGVFNDREILSIEGWLWLAEKGLDLGQYSSLRPDWSTYIGSYYACWQNIWLLSASDPQSPLSFLSSVVLLIPRLFCFGTLQRRVSLDAIIARLESLIVSPEMRSAVGKTVAVVCEKFGEKFADRVSNEWARLQRMKVEIGAVPIGPIDGTELVEDVSTKTRARDKLRRKLGDVLFGRIGDACKCQLTSAFVALEALTADLDGNDLPIVINAICSPIEAELKEKFWQAIWKYPAKADLEELGISDKKVTLGTLAVLLACASNNPLYEKKKAAFQKLASWCVRKRIPIKDLVPLEEDVNEVCKCRNPSIHGTPVGGADESLAMMLKFLAKILSALNP